MYNPHIQLNYYFEHHHHGGGGHYHDANPQFARYHDMDAQYHA
jgi:hypothetical protein